MRHFVLDSIENTFTCKTKSSQDLGQFGQKNRTYLGQVKILSDFTIFLKNLNRKKNNLEIYLSSYTSQKPVRIQKSKIGVLTLEVRG